MYLYTVSLVYWQLLLYGVHVGHSFINSIIFSAWLVYTYRQNILIINLFKTVLLFKNGYVGLNAACHFSGPIWFINLHRAVELFVNYSAKQCGEFCYTTYWVHGLISNWITLANTFKKLNRMVKNSNKGQFAKLELDSSPLILGRFSWPRASFISSVHTSPHPTKESLYLGIPCLGIVDTNVSGHIANIAIPGNDDSLDCIVFYNTHVSQYILEKKYANVSGWFFNVRKNLRAIKFFDWVFAKYINNKGHLNELQVFEEERKRKESENQLKNDLKYRVSYNNLWTYGLDLFFSRNYGLDNFKEQVDLYEPSGLNSKYDIDLFLTEHRYSSLYVSKIVNYYIIKASWRFNRFVKRNTLKQKLFNRRFLVGVYEKVRLWKVTDSKNYMKARFYVNRIFKTHLRKNKYRSNKFILKFLKFHFIKKYMNVRGFVSLYKSNWLNISSLAFVAISFGSRLFQKDIFSPLIKVSNFFNYRYNKGKKNILYKWSFFKKSLKQCISSIVNNKYINKYYKISTKWNLYNLLKKYFRKKLFSFNLSFKSFFNFYIWNRISFLRRKYETLKHSFKIWGFIKSMEKNYDYLNFLNTAYNSLNYFLFSFYKNKKFLNYFYKSNLKPYLSYFFKTSIDNYTKGFFLNVNPFVYNKLFRFLHKFRLIMRKNKKIRARILKIFKKHTKPKYKYIKHSKNYKGKKKLRKIKIGNQKINFNAKFFRTLRYKKNKVLPILARKSYYLRKNLKFVRLYNFMNTLPLSNRVLPRVHYFLKSAKNALFVNFTHFPISYNKMYSKNLQKQKFIRNLNIKPLSLQYHDAFSEYHSKSFYRFNSLISRYSVNYFFKWNELFTKDKDRAKYLQQQRDYLSILEYKNSNLNYFLLKTKIDSELGHMFLRRRAYRVYKKAIRTASGISHYFLLGNNILNVTFFDKYWSYTKNNFYLPEFFYLNFKLQKFKIFKPLYKKFLKRKIFYNNLSYFIYPAYLRTFSLYNKYFYSFYKSHFPFYKKLLLRYNNTHKKIFWS